MMNSSEAARHFKISESRLQAICREINLPRERGYKLTNEMMREIGKYRSEHPRGRRVGWKKEGMS